MKDFKEILEKIAKENGTTPENVLQEMQRAIDEAYDHHACKRTAFMGYDDLQR